MSETDIAWWLLFALFVAQQLAYNAAHRAHMRLHEEHMRLHDKHLQFLRRLVSAVRENGDE